VVYLHPRRTEGIKRIQRVLWRKCLQELPNTDWCQFQEAVCSAFRCNSLADIPAVDLIMYLAHEIMLARLMERTGYQVVVTRIQRHFPADRQPPPRHLVTCWLIGQLYSNEIADLRSMIG